MKRLGVALVCFVVVAGLLIAAMSIWPKALGMVVFRTVGPVVWPYVEPYLKNFPESPNRDAVVEGKHPVAACQNSHADFGERTRVNQSLDGIWQVDEGGLVATPPAAFAHTVPVPGLLTEAEPPFTEVGVESDQREAFWYRRTFRAPDEPDSQAFLCLEKAKYGPRVWLNGVDLGQHFGPFTVSEYDLTEAIRWGEENELFVRVGADRSAIPEFIPAGADSEKGRWYPGLWDSVTVVYTGPHSIVRVKVEPRLRDDVVTVRTTVRNGTVGAARLHVEQTIYGITSGAPLGPPVMEAIELQPGETVESVLEVPLTDPPRWTPESPELLQLRTRLSEDGFPLDDRVVRFGMREFEWRSGDEAGFYLNGKRYYLRGTNIAFHRFLEDQDRGRLAWDRDWIEKLLSGHPKDVGWNSFRFHIGRAPNAWYDAADEVGLIVTDEYHAFAPMAPGSEVGSWSLAEMEKEYAGWIQENWNHASIGWWDASNETNSSLPYEVVPRVRELDETRAWESGSYRPPDRPDDPLEEHPYVLNGASFMNTNDRDYTLEDLDDHPGVPPLKQGEGLFSTWNGPETAGHAYVNNEYGWLWHTRDGTDPTPITADAFAKHSSGAELSPEERREMYAYLVGELSGFWRSRRGYAGVQHFLYLGKCTDADTVREPWEEKSPSFTCDNFIDVPNQVLEPRWREAARSAFAPVAVYLEKWSDAFYRRGEKVEVPVTLINDEYEDVRAVLRLLAATPDGEILAESKAEEVVVPSLGRVEAKRFLDVPDRREFVLYAELAVEGRRPVYSRRKVGLAHPGVDVIAPRFATEDRAPRAAAREVSSSETAR